MDTLNIPTKRNLLLARHRLALARRGYDLLDKKRHVLISELAATQGLARQTWNCLCEAIHVASIVLHVAQSEMGLERVQKVSRDMPSRTVVDMCFHGIMGTEVPLINSVGIKSDECSVPYDLGKTTASLDEAVQAWNKARELIVAWVAIENTIRRLSLHIRKTQKRANALGNITIPLYETRIKYIQERLEERERDELARLKLVKERSLKSNFK